eukprot:scaffold7181_cov173-Cylindrotheca_fusiformis.AAC.3
MKEAGTHPTADPCTSLKMAKENSQLVERTLLVVQSQIQQPKQLFALVVRQFHRQAPGIKHPTQTTTSVAEGCQKLFPRDHIPIAGTGETEDQIQSQDTRRQWRSHTRAIGCESTAVEGISFGRSEKTTILRSGTLGGR